MVTGTVFNIQRYSVHDGPGIRTTVFLKGCPLDCWWCHNPEGRSPEPEIGWLAGRCSRCGECRRVCPQTWPGADAGEPVGQPAGCVRCGACVAVCPTEARQMVGRRMTVDEVLAEVRKDRVFHEESAGGVTFSGGEPLGQPEFLLGLLEACQAEGWHTAVDTCGHAPQEQLLAAARWTDLFLYDVKVVDDALHRQLTGVSNGRILDNLRVLGRLHRNIWVRVPLIPGYNDGREQIDALGKLAASVPGARRVSLLPYHPMGNHKAAGPDGSRPAPQVAPPSAESLENTAETLRAHGLDVRIGG